MRTTVPIMAALLALCACDAGPTNLATPAAPSIRLPAAPGRPGVGYFDLLVQGDRGGLVSVSSPQVARIEMHETMSSGNMTSMRPIARIPAADGDRIIFTEGGRHLMLFEIDPALRPGDQALLVFHFEQGSSRTMAAIVTSAGGETR